MPTRKPNPRDLSPKDRVATTAHLAETIQYNSKHSYNHAKAAANLAKGLKDHPQGETIRHNAEHALKHAKDVMDHAGKLMNHLKGYPGTDSAMKELMNPRPTPVATPPGKPGVLTPPKKKK